MTDNAAVTRVLVVDDDQDVNDSVCATLRERGYQVASASNGREALDHLATAAADVIVLDLSMPVMDGYAFRKEQQSDARLVLIPTIVLTAGAVDQSVVDLGVAGWVRKPLNRDTLVRTIERHRRRPVADAHSVLFYDSDATLTEQIVAYLKEGLDRDEGALGIVTPAHRELLVTGLAEQGIDVESARAREQLVLLDARTLLQSFTVDGAPDEARFNEVLGAATARVQRRHPKFRIYGELADLLCASGDIAGALTLEAFWNRLLKRLSCPVRCGCAAPLSESDRQSFARLGAAHAHVVGADAPRA
jgi:CheY-like chemotaxis protein